MAFTLNSNITIGQFKKVKPNEVKIQLAISNYVNTCKIKLPASAHLVCENKAEKTNTVQTAQQFKEGDKVVVQLGYNGILKTEFTGFVARINIATPVEVECEGYSYQLRKKTPAPKTFKKAELKEVLKYIITGTDIVLDADIQGCVLEKIVINGHNGVEVLELIKKTLGDLVFMHFHNNVLYAGLTFLNPQQTVKYQLGWNVIKDNNLKQRQAKNDKITIVYKGKKKDGSNVQAVLKSKGQSKVITTEGEAGNGGETKTIVTHSVTDEATLKKMAEAKLKN
ncbi:MAG: hypothetical protein IPP48_03420 [Chitinophagaceae bacterium]|nr:hypothetical protein [Chitinophagaceae bacterium]